MIDTTLLALAVGPAAIIAGLFIGLVGDPDASRNVNRARAEGYEHWLRKSRADAMTKALAKTKPVAAKRVAKKAPAKKVPAKKGARK